MPFGRKSIKKSPPRLIQGYGGQLLKYEDLQGTLDLDDVEGLDDVAFLDIVVSSD